MFSKQKTRSYHTNSTYPKPIDELNLNYISHLQQKYPNSEIGYSGHEFGLVTTRQLKLIPNATWVERHITMDRNVGFRPCKTSVEPIGVWKLVKGIRDVENALLGSKGERVLLDGELSKRESLRGEDCITNTHFRGGSKEIPNKTL